MSGYRLTPTAQADLDSIYDYTAETWGPQQATRYILDIEAACAALVSGRRRGRAIGEVRLGMFKLAVGSHILFFERDGDAVDVIRILHQRMDTDRHL